VALARILSISLSCSADDTTPVYVYVENIIYPSDSPPATLVCYSNCPDPEKMKHAAGFFGTAVATMGMLATAAYILAMDTFGPIVDNARGIAEQSGLEDKVVGPLDSLMLQETLLKQ
jgi:hypothetical protein